MTTLKQPRFLAIAFGVLALLMVSVSFVLAGTTGSRSAGVVINDYGLTLQAGAIASGAGTVANVGGLNTISVNISTIGSGTINFEGSVDGTNFIAITCVEQSTQRASSTATQTGIWLCPVASYDFFQARISGFTTGAVTATALAVQNGAGPLVALPGGWNYTHIVTATATVNTVVKSGAGVLHSIIFNTNAAGASTSLVQVFDNTACNGSQIATGYGSAVTGTAVIYDVNFNNGLCITQSGKAVTADLTVVTR